MDQNLDFSMSHSWSQITVIFAAGVIISTVLFPTSSIPHLNIMLLKFQSKHSLFLV